LRGVSGPRQLAPDTHEILEGMVDSHEPTPSHVVRKATVCKRMPIRGPPLI
jgi:hypothetical protein